MENVEAMIYNEKDFLPGRQHKFLTVYNERDFPPGRQQQDPHR